MTTCAFTGHRHILPEHRKNMSVLLLRAINYAYQRGCRRFIAGGAVGFDTEAERAVLRFRVDHPDIKLILFLPCLTQDNDWSMAQRDAYEYILRHADEVKYISEEYDKDCMRRRNQQLAQECDILISYVDRERSGSAQTVRFAKKLGKEVYNIYSHLNAPTIC